MTIHFKRLDERAKLPSYANPGDAAMDVYALEDVTLHAGAEPVKVRTGIASEIPEGYFASARNRSGLSSKGVHLLGGVIDSTYRGEWAGILQYFGPLATYEIKAGDRIFQAVIQKHETPEIVEAFVLTETVRGVGGFGSTGR